MSLLYRNSRYRRVRGLQYGFWLVAFLFALAPFLLPHIWPEGDAIALAILSPIMASIALGMELYRGLYVTAIEALPEGLRVETMAFLGRRSQLLPWSAVPGSAGPERIYFARGAASTAITLRRPGKRLPFLIDTTEEAFDPATLRRLARRYKPRG